MFFKVLKYLIGILSIFLILLMAVLFVPPLWRNITTYPALDKQVANYNSHWKQPPEVTELTCYRGIMHAHSYWSHDSEGTLHDILPAAKNAGIDFIFLTDHPHGLKDTFPRGYHGYYDGVLIVPGSEKQQFAAWPLSDGIIDWNKNKDSLAKEVIAAGGLLFYAHTEEPHNWASPWYQGMEIYNFHTDTKDEKLLPHIANFLVNGKKYRHWAMRQLFDEQTDILALWDSLNRHRQIVGYSAVDTHENQNIRARKLSDNQIQWVGPNANPFDTVNVNFWNRWFFNEPDANGWVFKLMIDTYEEGFNYITNYVLADTLSVTSLSEQIRKGHLYTAFKSLGDAKGFIYWSANAANEVSGLLGDSVTVTNAASLHATSPLSGRFRLIHNGNLAAISPEDSYDFHWEKPLTKGAYRIEVHLPLGNRLIPWLYTNPIYVY